MLTNRVLRFLLERAAKEPDQFDQFYRDYGLFLKEGIVTGQLQNEKVRRLSCTDLVIKSGRRTETFDSPLTSDLNIVCLYQNNE